MMKYNEYKAKRMAEEKARKKSGGQMSIEDYLGRSE